MGYPRDRGLEVGQGDGLGGFLCTDFGVQVILGPLLHEDVFEGLAGGVLGEVGFGGERAVGGVEDDLFDVRLELGLSLLAAGAAGRGGGDGFGEALESDLEAIEEETGAARVELVLGDASEDFADRELDGGAVLGHGEGEGSLAGAASAELGDGLARGVVEVAEGFAAEAGRAAAAAFGEDVAALEAFGFSSRHDGWSPPRDGFLWCWIWI